MSGKQKAIKVTQDKTKLIRAALRELEGNQLLVGIPDIEAGRVDAETREEMKTLRQALRTQGDNRRDKQVKVRGALAGLGYSEQVNNAEIGYLQEHGSPAMRLPARAFLVPGVKEVMDKATKMLRRGGERALDGKPGMVMDTFIAVGLMLQAAVRRKITDGPFAPLSETTLALRRERGVKRDKPLVDTGQLRNSINFVIRPKKKR